MIHVIYRPGLFGPGGCREAPSSRDEQITFNPIQQRLTSEEPTDRGWPERETTDPWGITPATP